MDGGRSNKRQAVARPEGQSKAKRQNVTMGLDTLDCPVCSKPLRPPIFQYLKGDFICSACCAKLPTSERAAPKRCYGMERVVNNIFVPCKHGCLTKLTYYDIEEHEMMCVEGPCFCPVSGCGFAAQPADLLDHLITLHKLPTKSIRYFVPFGLRVQPGSHVLCGGYRRLFLLNVESLESLGHAVSIVCAQPSTPSGTIGCSVAFSCFKGHYQVSSLDIEGSKELQTQSFCVVPKVSGEPSDVVLSITINLLYRDDAEPDVEEDDEENSYCEEEDDEMTRKWRMAFTKLEVKEEGDEDSEEEEEEEEEEDNMVKFDWTRWVVTITNEKEKEDDKDDQTTTLVT